MWSSRRKEKIILVLLPVSFLLIVFANVFGFGSSDDHPLQQQSSSEDILKTVSVSVDDLIAMVFWEENSSQDLRRKIIREKEEGKRDQVIQIQYLNKQQLWSILKICFLTFAIISIIA
jgi:hypothetical protein